MSTRKRNQSVRSGDIAAVPLKDGSWAIAQVVGLAEEMGCALVNFYSYRARDTMSERESWPMDAGDLVAVQFVPIFAMRRGHWPLMGNVAPKVHDFGPDLTALQSVGYVGMQIADANTMQAVMNAYHGLSPWIIGADEAYLTRLTVPNLRFGQSLNSMGSA